MKHALHVGMLAPKLRVPAQAACCKQTATQSWHLEQPCLWPQTLSCLVLCFGIFKASSLLVYLECITHIQVPLCIEPCTQGPPRTQVCPGCVPQPVLPIRPLYCLMYRPPFVQHGGNTIRGHNHRLCSGAYNRADRAGVFGTQLAAAAAASGGHSDCSAISCGCGCGRQQLLAQRCF
jgi:hypothetical protein